jgi:tripartite-type tricarboxylate transporter receptor subunit TctC
MARKPRPPAHNRFAMEATMNAARHAFAVFTLTLAVIVAALAGARAEDFPSRPVHFIVPYAAGGSGDLLARLLGDKLASLWGQQVVVEDKPGAGGLIGTDAAAKAPADGYTLYLATDGPLTVAATLNKHVPYDWKKDFAPVSMITVGYQILLSSPKLPATNLKDFIALAQKNPGKYNFASIGVGTAPHLAAELFLSMANLKLTHVPYRGSSQQSIAALISGDVAMFVVGTSTAVPFVQAGTVHGLAVTAPKRIDSLPNVPTFAEQGFPKMDYSLWFAVLVPSATPSAIVKKLNADIVKAVADPTYQKALKVRGFEARSSTPEELAAFMDKDYIKNRALIQKLGLHID